MEVSFLDNQPQLTAGLFETKSCQSDVVRSSLDHSRVNEDWLRSGLFQKWKKTRPDRTLKHYVVL